MKILLAIVIQIVPFLSVFATTPTVTNVVSAINGPAALQVAVESANEGDTILVGPGTYSPIRTLGKKIIIKSTDGAEKTIIDGKRMSRCAALANDIYDYDADGVTIDGSTLIGFTLKCGYDYGIDDDHNTRDTDGGGLFGGVAINCIIRDSECHLIYDGEEDGCGGGACRATLYNCLITGNKALMGAGASDCILYNCTIVANDSGSCPLGYSEAYNCIISGGSYLDSWDMEYHNCMVPVGEYSSLPSGVVRGDVKFVDAATGDYRLQKGSVAIDSGTAAYVQKLNSQYGDLDENERVKDVVDLGAYEYGFIKWEYSMAEGGISLDRVTPKTISGDLVVPEKIDGHPVVKIAERAFEGCSSITSVTVPKSVTAIAEGAFSGCSSLTNMVLPFIGAARQSALPLYTTKASFGYIFGKNSYEGDVATAQEWTNGVSVTYYIPASLSSVTILDETETGGNAFRNCGNLKTVILNGGLRRIRGSTFYNCKRLVEVYIPETVETIIASAFYGCRNLEQIFIPASVDDIGSSAFRDCSALTAVLFEGNAPTVGGSCFYGVNASCVARVSRKTSGWTVDAEGRWNGLILEYIETEQDLIDELKDFADSKLAEYIKDGKSYTAFSTWVSGLKGVSFDQIKTSPNAWLSYALDLPALIEGDMSEERLKVISFEPMENNLFTIRLGLDGADTGDNADAGNLMRSFAVEGTQSLEEDGFSVTNVAVEAALPEAGAVTFAVAPRVESDSFFFRTRLLDGKNGVNRNGCPVSFDLGDGGVLPNGVSSQIYVSYTGEYGTLPVPVREGYKFLGWFSALEGGEKVDAESKMGFDFSKTLYAQWEKTYVYCVIDLSAGPNATSYAVSFHDAVPVGGWTDEYKTTKLVLRRIESGSFKMNGLYDVTISRSFYMGVFEVTQKQYELITGNIPSSYKGDARPVESVTWNMIRGNSDTYNWPNIKTVDANSFVGRLRAKTGLAIDLPAEAQWEYACRAGTTSSFNNGGNSESDLATLGRYDGNRNDGRGGYPEHTKVGSYVPNAWGLYDMHGNVFEWCLDWCGGLMNSSDPVGPTSGAYRVLRGGSWWSVDVFRCNSSYRGNYYTSFVCDHYGFRLAMDANVQMITFDTNDGTGQNTIARMKGDALGELPMPIREGYTFAGWWTEAEGGEQVTASTVVTGPQTLYARWKTREKVQLWEGGPYWATTNIGAEKPEDYGYYFWWGDTVGYKRENDKWVASDGSNSNFSFTESNTPTYGKDNSTLQSEGWITADGVLSPEHDAAKKHWGSDWRMPTKQEIDNLNSKCDWTWTTVNGVNGYIVCGRGDYASNSIFLPCAGRALGTTLDYVGSDGRYWSSVLYSNSKNAYDFSFYLSGHSAGNIYRTRGQSIRPIQSMPCVIFDTCGGSSVDSIFIPFGQALGELPNPTREGYTFVGWFTAVNGGTQVTASTVVTGSQTLYARWKTREKVQLWEGGPYWATTNIGAEKPEDYGYYFWWGDTVGYKRENDKWVASDGSNSNFSFTESNTPTYGKDNSTLQSEGWITSDGVLVPEHDAAHKHWGGDWRMPTNQELINLKNNCDWTWTTINGVRGYVVRGRGDYASVSIFLPCSGYGLETALSTVGSHGYYGSSIPDANANNYMRYLFFHSSYYNSTGGYRNRGRSVRPVQGLPCVIFDTCGGSSIDSIAIPFGQALGELPIPTREGYTFVGWFMAVSGGTQVTASTVVTGSQTLYARWAIKSYAVVFDANGGSGGVSKSYNHGSTLGELPVPTREGYAFVGWFTAVSGGTQVIASTVVTADITLYAHWTIKSYTVVFDANGGGGGVSKSYNHGSILGDLPVPTREGYVFVGWFTAVSGGTQVTASTVVAADITLYAHWTIKSYTVVFDANGGSGGVSKSYNHGATLGELPVSTRNGYVFVGWFTAVSGGTQVTASTVVTGSQTLYARWKTREKVQLWEGGPYWATTNIGAEEPWESGYYFWWGDTVGYKRENDKWVASDGSNSDFSFRDVGPTENKSVLELKWEGWITSEGVLAPEYDAAKKHWGGDWRMPTKQEFDDLINKCDWAFTTVNGVNGCILKGRGVYASNSIFLPYAGYGFRTLLYNDYVGYYWSSVPCSDSSNAWHIELFYSGGNATRSYFRSLGQLVRPVQGASCVAVTFDACGGSSVDSISIPFGQSFGDLPIPTREGYVFVGWFTAVSGGTQVTANTTASVSMTTLYAQWEKVLSVTLSGALDIENMEVTAGGNVGWFGQKDVSQDAVDAAQSGDISDGQTSWMEVVVKDVSSVSFWWKVSSESNYDKLHFYVDGTEVVDPISGQRDWIKVEYKLAAGSHTLKWSYTKDGSVSNNDDCGWVDSVVLLQSQQQTHEKVQLWEGGPYWATTNIGAEKPEDYGYYFWWGDTVGYKRENDKWVASDGSNSNFSFTESNTPTCNKSVATLQSEGWITSSSVLAPEYDAAQAHWGGDWRMPTMQEFNDLNNNCDWTWTTVNGVNGYIVRGRGEYASNSIFLPSAGYGSRTLFDLAGSYGGYWSSVPYSDGDDARSLGFGSGGHLAFSDHRYHGQSVRPVKSFETVIYTVTFNANGGEGGTTLSRDYGSSLGSLPTPSREGYTFAGWWTAAEGGEQVTASTVVTGNVTYYAHWQVKTYSVDFNANGGAGGSTISRAHGETLGTLPTPTRDGYTFAGWWTAASGGTQVTASTVVTGNVTYYAHWQIKTYEVIFDATGGIISFDVETGGPGGILIYRGYGETLGALPTPTRAGYTFDGWWTAASGGTRVSAWTIVTGHVTYYAQWINKDSHGMVQLWNGGPYWATTNIGAEKPEDYGYYFWWGDILGYKRENNKWVRYDGYYDYLMDFSEYNVPTSLEYEGWITSDRVLAPEHDAAAVRWGNGWRMPTVDELSALVSKCDWTWTTQNGVSGYVVRGRGVYVSNSIFLPAAGFGANGNFLGEGSQATYLSSSPDGGDRCSMLFFNSVEVCTHFTYNWYGHPIRPVKDFD